MPNEIITRRRLPHWYVAGACHFVTYRLADTIPLAALLEIRQRKEAALKKGPAPVVPSSEFRERVHKQHFADYDRYLDQCTSVDWLAQPEIAAVVRANLYHHAGKKYQLIAYCIMPNHVHVLLQPLVVGQAASLASPLVGQAASLASPGECADGESPLAEIMHSLKSYTAKQANKILRRSGPFWQHESYDHWVRDDNEMQRIVDYIIGNPVKAKLADEPQRWLFGSALDRFIHDGSRCGVIAYPA